MIARSSVPVSQMGDERGQDKSVMAVQAALFSVHNRRCESI